VTGTSKATVKAGKTPNTGKTVLVALDAATRSRIAARAAGDKKGDDVLVLDVGEIMGIVEYFVITSASNTRMVRSIVDEVEHQLHEQTGEKPRAVEGLRDASWVLLDYGDVVVHVFLHETREYYGLERLWADAATLPWADSATTAS
jgi:ribosome-associated protein